MTFYTSVLRRSNDYVSTKKLCSLKLLEPGTRARVSSVISAAGMCGIEVVVFETYRSCERQAELFAKGVTQLRDVSTHHYGLACDVVRLVNGKPTWQTADYSFLGDLAREHQLIWGGDWGRPDLPNQFVDAVHVQRCAITRQEALFSGRWYPDAEYNPYDDMRTSTVI